MLGSFGCLSITSNGLIQSPLLASTKCLSILSHPITRSKCISVLCSSNYLDFDWQLCEFYILILFSVKGVENDIHTLICIAISLFINFSLSPNTHTNSLIFPIPYGFDFVVAPFPKASPSEHIDTTHTRIRNNCHCISHNEIEIESFTVLFFCKSVLHIVATESFWTSQNNHRWTGMKFVAENISPVIQPPFFDLF